MPLNKETIYSKLSSSEDGSLLSSEGDEHILASESKRRRPLCNHLLVMTICNAIFFITACVFFVLGPNLPSTEDENMYARKLSIWCEQEPPTQMVFPANVSSPAPALEAVEYEEMDFQNRFDEPSVYRGPPTEQREQAWLDLWDHAAISFPEDKLSLLNKSTSTQSFRRLPESEGGGFSGLPDVFHQLHCLDMIRQYTWLQSGNYGDTPETAAGEPKALPLVPTPPAFRGSTDIANRMHADHCIETIRKTLMCHADVTPLLIVADPNNPIGDRPDFNIHQKCRNWDAIRQWTTDHLAVGRA